MFNILSGSKKPSPSREPLLGEGALDREEVTYDFASYDSSEYEATAETETFDEPAEIHIPLPSDDSSEPSEPGESETTLPEESAGSETSDCEAASSVSNGNLPPGREETNTKGHGELVTRRAARLLEENDGDKLKTLRECFDRRNRRREEIKTNTRCLVCDSNCKMGYSMCRRCKYKKCEVYFACPICVKVECEEREPMCGGCAPNYRYTCEHGKEMWINAKCDICRAQDIHAQRTQRFEEGKRKVNAAAMPALRKQNTRLQANAAAIANSNERTRQMNEGTMDAIEEAHAMAAEQLADNINRQGEQLEEMTNVLNAAAVLVDAANRQPDLQLREETDERDALRDIFNNRYLEGRKKTFIRVPANDIAELVANPDHSMSSILNWLDTVNSIKPIVRRWAIAISTLMGWFMLAWMIMHLLDWLPHFENAWSILVSIYEHPLMWCMFVMMAVRLYLDWRQRRLHINYVIEWDNLEILDYEHVEEEDRRWLEMRAGKSGALPLPATVDLTVGIIESTTSSFTDMLRYMAMSVLRILAMALSCPATVYLSGRDYIRSSVNRAPQDGHWSWRLMKFICSDIFNLARKSPFTLGNSRSYEDGSMKDWAESSGSLFWRPAGKRKIKALIDLRLAVAANSCVPAQGNLNDVWGLANSMVMRNTAINEGREETVKRSPQVQSLFAVTDQATNGSYEGIATQPLE